MGATQDSEYDGESCQHQRRRDRAELVADAYVKGDGANHNEADQDGAPEDPTVAPKANNQPSGGKR
ncbi:hypothetical protein PCCS19_00270 [Paenibacillus sp. CCS19]|nr:hypothetical protein [Paenibacillus cellulosilyticus]GMK36974.1 hypothetical protein PCCS19_00270 [Paenibacillus cellulosilyticus]